MRVAGWMLAVLLSALPVSAIPSSEPAWTRVSTSLRRLNYVPPVMPQIAIDQQIEGYVEVVITIETDGTLSDVTVSSARPEGIFEEAALAAVRQWIYEPVTKNGVPVTQRAMLRVNFKLPSA